VELLLLALLIRWSFVGTGVWPSFRYPDDGYGLSTLLLIIVLMMLLVVLVRRLRL
jgi:hypothetical protein